MPSALTRPDPGDHGKPAHPSPFHSRNGPFGAFREEGHCVQEGGTECCGTNAPRHSVGARNGTFGHPRIENGSSDGGEIGCWLRPDTPCDSNDVMTRHSRLVDEAAANATTSSKDGDAHGPLSLTSATGGRIVIVCRRFLPTFWPQRSGHPL